MLKNYSKHIAFWMLAIVVFTACKTYVPIQEKFSLNKINKTILADSATLAYYLPYKDSLDKIMKIPLAELAEDLSKKMPESTLGNMMADILKIKTAAYTNQTIDVAILNYGGIRTPSLSKGTLMVEHAYLLMPFDNYLVEQILTGQQLSDYCDSLAIKGGWPVAGIAFVIKNKKASDIRVNGIPIDLKKNYNVATNDYLANGGDGMTFLKTIPQIQTGKLYRDAIIEYWKEQTKAGKKIQSNLENRIQYAE